MSNEILEAVREHGEKFDRELKSLDGKIESALTEMAQKMETAPGDGRGDRGNKGNPLTKAAAELVAKAAGVANREQKSASVSVKGFVVGDTAGTSEEGYIVPPQHDPRLGNDPRRRLSLLDALPRIRVSSNSFEYNALDGYSNAAGYQANEGALKPQGDMPTSLRSSSIATVAHWIGASRQVLADAPALEQQMRSLMTYGVLRKLETEIIAGAGGTGQIAGLTDSDNYTAYSLAASGDTLADAVAKGQTALDTAGWTANLVIVNPNDWRALLTERDASGGGGGLYVAGSWRDPAPPSIWGVPVVTSAAVSAGNFIIMDTSQVAILDRQEARVEVGYADDDFVRNRVRLLAELRAGLAVFSPSAVLHGDFES